MNTHPSVEMFHPPCRFIGISTLREYNFTA